MEESWKERTRPSTQRARTVDTLGLHSSTLMLYISQWVKALVSYGSEAEAFLRKSVLGHGEKGKSNHERRKYEPKSSSDDQSKLRQLITQPRTGRWGYLLFLFAAIGMLAFISQNTSLSQHVDKELERAALTNNQRGMELTLNRKVKFVETSHLIYEEGQAEARQENEDKWPQESVQMSSLRRKAASGTLRVGLLNFKSTTDIGKWKFLAGKNPTTVPFERVAKTIDWMHLFPEWIDDEAKFGTPKCPVFPMPKVPPVPYVSSAVQLDVVIARAPCAESSTLQEGWRDPAILQVLLGAANLAVEAGSESIYVLILSKCRPLINLFPCGELLEHHDEGRLYNMNVEQLKKRTSLPIGSCQLSVPLSNKFYARDDMGASTSQREAYATILHSGAEFVCGAIAVAQSIRSTGSTRDLVVLVDTSILPEHRKGLEEAGWKVRDYEKISSSETQKDFSKFRLWQLDYDKVIYLDADVIVLRNIDHLFRLPEVSASGTTQSVFNAGVMVIEPSNCTFQVLMDEMEKLVSEVKDDWEFFNRVFPWWHRIPRNMNALKYFWTRRQKDVDYMNGIFSANPPQLYTIHYITGQKPWKCFRDYDCNWNGNQHYASNEAHAQWFKVYDQMPENLKQHCALSTRAREDLEKDRRVAATSDLPDRHWAINITDPRLNVCQGNHCDFQVCQQNHCDWNVMLKSVNPTVNSSITVNATNTVVAAMK